MEQLLLPQQQPAPLPEVDQAQVRVPAITQIPLHQHQSVAPVLPLPTNYNTPEGMSRKEFRAMGTTISLLLPERQSVQGKELVRALFAEWEQSLSRFLPESELSRLNLRAGTATPVSELLYTVLATALTAAQATEGVYDPAMLEQLIQVGYDRTFDELEVTPFSPLFPESQAVAGVVFE